jgi:hypothetical protein
VVAVSFLLLGGVILPRSPSSLLGKQISQVLEPFTLSRPTSLSLLPFSLSLSHLQGTFLQRQLGFHSPLLVGSQAIYLDPTPTLALALTLSHHQYATCS